MLRTIFRTLAIALAMGFFIQPAHAYEVLHTSSGVELRWHTTTIPYYVNTDGLQDFDPNQVQSTIERCMGTWEALNFGARFEFMGFTTVKDALDDDMNVVFFVQSADKWQQLFPGQDLALAMTRTWAISTGEIQGFDLAFNDARYTFTNSDDPAATVTDFANTATHELGHVLGLDHTGINEAAMYSTSSQGEMSKRVLNEDDIAGVGYVYRDGFQIQDDDGISCSVMDADRGSRAQLVPLALLLAMVVLVLRWRRADSALLMSDGGGSHAVSDGDDAGVDVQWRDPR